MVAVWVHDMGDFKKVTVTSSGDDPDAYAEKWWGLGRLIWSREVSGDAEGRSLQKAILGAGGECSPSDFIPDTKLTGKTCYVGEVDFESLEWEVPVNLKYTVYMLRVDAVRFKCGYTSKPEIPEDSVWYFAVSSLEKAKEFTGFVHGKLSKTRHIVEGMKCFVPLDSIDKEYCIAQYKEWIASGKPKVISRRIVPEDVELIDL